MMSPSQNMLPTVTPATSYSSCSTCRGATRLRMTSLTAVKLRPLTWTSTVSSSTTRRSRAAASSFSAAPVASLPTPVSTATRRRRSAMDDLDGVRGRLDRVHRGRRERRPPVAEIDEVLHVPLRSGMAGVADTQNHGAVTHEPRADGLEDVAVDGRVAHHAAFPHALPAGLELRLDEHEAAVAAAQRF